MLDQNTDRMWYVIGAIVIGAAIIAMGLNIFSDSFGSVESSYTGFIGIADDSMDGLNVVVVSDGMLDYKDIGLNRYEVVGLSESFAENNDGKPLRIDIPASYDGKVVTSIGDYAFQKKNVQSVEFPNSLKNIGRYAFHSNRISEVILPEGLVTVDYAGFNDNRIHTLYLPESLDSIGHYAFRINRLTTLDLPERMSLMGRRAFSNNLLNSEDAFIYARGANGLEDRSKIVAYGGTDKHLVIPSNVTHIGISAFEFSGLESVVIPNTVTKIESRAFNRNQLADDDAFIYARNLDGSINSKTLVSYGGANRAFVRIPNNVVNIQTSAFSWCSILEVEIPDSVEFISASAFSANGPYRKSNSIPNNGRWYVNDLDIWVQR